MLVELNVVEQRYQAVLEVLNDGASVTDVARRRGVARQTVHGWLRRYAADGLGGLADRSSKPLSCPHQMAPEVEALVVEMRRAHLGWGPRTSLVWLDRAGVCPLPGRSSVERCLIRHGLVTPQARKRKRSDYKRWERSRAMELWQMDIVGGVKIADGSEAKIVSGIDDHARFVVSARVVARARPVCDALEHAMNQHGVPEEILTDNGKVFTARFGPGPGPVLFDKICNDNGIKHRLAAPRSPTTTGKVERWHKTMRREFLDGKVFDSIEYAQAELDAWVHHYNYVRPHQSLGGVAPVERFKLAERREKPARPLLETATVSGPVTTRRVSAKGTIGFATVVYKAGTWLAGRPSRSPARAAWCRFTTAGCSSRPTPRGVRVVVPRFWLWMKMRRIGAWHRCRIGRREDALVVGRHVYLWKLDDDVINGPADGEQQYRTVISRSATAPGLGALVIGLSTRSDRSDVIALGVVWRRRAVATGRVSSRVDPFVMLRSPIPVQSLRDRVDHHILRALDGAAAGDPLTPARLTRRSAEKLVQAIREADADADRLLSSLAQDAVAVAGLDGMRLREERDAVELSLELANVSMEPYMSRLRTAVGPGEAFGASLDPYFVLDCEDDLIAEDLRRFDESATIQRIAGSASVVTDDDLRLTIINVNRRPLEKVHGVDLVYYDHVTDQATVVQYKRLERVEVKNAGRTSSDWVFRRKAELVRQLELMEVDQRLPPSSLADWRLSPSPAFFKFVRGEDFDPDGAAVLRGMYVPADYLRVGIEEGAFDTGPQGGFRLGHSNTRYLSRAVFIELVRRGWVGTCRTDRSSLASDVAALAQEHEVVLALRNRDGRSSFGSPGVADDEPF